MMAASLRGHVMGPLAVTFAEGATVVGAPGGPRLQYPILKFGDEVAAAPMPQEGKRSRRQLQEADGCTKSDAFTVTSSLFSDSAGCYTMTSSSVFENSDKGVISAFPLGSSSSEIVWVAGHAVSSSSLGTTIVDPDCYSKSTVSDAPHPSDVEVWLCDLNGTGVNYTQVTAAAFSTPCGCTAKDLATPSPSAPVATGRTEGTASPEAVASSTEEVTPSPMAARTTGTVSPEIVTSGSSTDELSTPSPVVARTTGTAAPEAVASSTEEETPSPIAAGATGTPSPMAAGATGTASPEIVTSGSSTVELSTPSPVVARTTGTAAPEAVASSTEEVTPSPIAAGAAGTAAPEAVVSRSGGGTLSPTLEVTSESPAPVTASRDLGTLAPSSSTSGINNATSVSTSTAVDGTRSCDELGSFMVSVPKSSLLAVLAGCYHATTSTPDQEGDHMFTVSGDESTGQMAVFPAYIDEALTDARWFSGYYDERASIIYCISGESPSEVHPTEASWNCDISGDASFPLATAEEFGLSCGCDPTSLSSSSMTSAAPTPSSTQTASAAPTAPSSAQTASAAPSASIAGSMAPTPVILEMIGASAAPTTAAPPAAIAEVTAAPTSSPTVASVAGLEAGITPTPAGVESTPAPVAGSRGIDNLEVSWSPTQSSTGFDQSNSGTRTGAFGGAAASAAGLLAAVVFGGVGWLFGPL